MIKIILQIQHLTVQNVASFISREMRKQKKSAAVGGDLGGVDEEEEAVSWLKPERPSPVEGNSPADPKKDELDCKDADSEDDDEGNEEMPCCTKVKTLFLFLSLSCFFSLPLPCFKASG